MERLKSLDFKICFDTDFSSAPLNIKFNSKIIHLKKGKTFLPLTVSSIDHTTDIQFRGYTPNDKDQRIVIELYYENTKLDTTILSTFQTYDNQYVKDTILNGYNEIHFNGHLTLQFFKQWFETNILKGAYINNARRFLHRYVLDYTNTLSRFDEDKKNYDIMCIGCSYTYGSEVENQDTWPYLLGQKLDLSVGNTGVVGMSIHGCLKQVLYCLKNYNTDKIIILLPTFQRLLYQFNFLNNSAFYNSTPMSTNEGDCVKFYDYEKQSKRLMKNSIRNGKRIIKYINNLDKNIYLTSWNDEVYASIPAGKNKLPIFPDIKTFTERANDGSHPHKKHYELFVKNIMPYIDKTQN